MQLSVAHILIGLVAGLCFRVETLLLLALFTFAEALCWGASNGVYAAFLWGLAAETFLQIGYVTGMCVRAKLERAGLVHVPPSRREA